MEDNTKTNNWQSLYEGLQKRYDDTTASNRIQWNHNYKMIQYLQGRCAILRHENNTLRRKVSKQKVRSALNRDISTS